MFTLSLVLVEVPSNLLVKRYGSRIWLSCLIGGCGLCTLLQAFCPGWRSLVALRFILGGFEGQSTTRIGHSQTGPLQETGPSV